ncbi:MAG: hypothetical protein NTX64_17415 [Elusimicrobia bacterium]|nr:hypothetical protein [Elusimicrobiota bacterium]
MCGICEKFGPKLACWSSALGVICSLVALVLRLTHACIETAGPKSFAAAAALLFLYSIATSVKKGDCCHTHEEPKTETK